MDERRSAVADADRREEREEPGIDVWHGEDVFRERRDDDGAHESDQPALAGNQVEHAVGGLHQMFGVFKAFVIVGFENFRIRLALQYERQLPGEVVGILYAGIHALAAGWCMHMRGITREETAWIGREACRERVSKEV